MTEPNRSASDVLSAIGHTPLIRLRRASEETGCTIYGKAEFLNPGLSVKDRAALSIVQDAEARGADPAGRHHRRGHGRQYRHRPRPGGLRARLPHGDRHPGHPVRGEEADPAARRRPARRGAGGAVLQPRQLRPRRPPPRREARRHGAGRRLLRRPVRQRRQPPGARGGDRPGDLGPDRRRGRRLRLRGRHGRHARRHRRGPARRAIRRCGSRSPIPRARPSTPTTPPAP